MISSGAECSQCRNFYTETNGPIRWLIIKSGQIEPIMQQTSCEQCAELVAQIAAREFSQRACFSEIGHAEIPIQCNPGLIDSAQTINVFKMFSSAQLLQLLMLPEESSIKIYEHVIKAIIDKKNGFVDPDVWSNVLLKTLPPSKDADGMRKFIFLKFKKTIDHFKLILYAIQELKIVLSGFYWKQAVCLVVSCPDSYKSCRDQMLPLLLQATQTAGMHYSLEDCLEILQLCDETSSVEFLSCLSEIQFLSFLKNLSEDERRDPYLTYFLTFVNWVQKMKTKEECITMLRSVLISLEFSACSFERKKSVVEYLYYGGIHLDILRAATCNSQWLFEILGIKDPERL